ncbi:hypothetical protein RJ640_003498 [Escallonia rubra]|uniref:Reverse transcriptase Ty1/copia-type domain-containing protein n=1 Tax=Escallonia rubra TaxID=112253 RepID=A0AA88RIA8_9ASTE|nr:hypothetical protein RJ640_003498 [Escallonia rubra]
MAWTPNIIMNILQTDDILLASSDMHMLHEIKIFLSKNMKDLGDASYVISIEIHRDRSCGILGLSQRAYIDKVLKRFNMHRCTPTVAPVVKGDKFSLLQCPRNQLEQDEMERIPYTSVVGSLIYAQVCTRPDIAYVIGMLGRYQINPGMSHWKAAKKVMRYLQGTKDFMLTYKKSNNLEQWVATELRQREPHDLTSVMASVERLEDFKQGERSRSPRYERAKDGGDGRSKNGSPKATDDDRSGDEVRRRHHKGEKKHEGNRKRGDSCDHVGPRRGCFYSAGPYCGNDCPHKGKMITFLEKHKGSKGDSSSSDGEARMGTLQTVNAFV